MPKSLKLILPLVILALAYVNTLHTDVVLLGATGDLAKKYLWQGLFNLYLEETGTLSSFSFYGCARRYDDQHGHGVLSDILKSSVKCNAKHSSCQNLKEMFISKTHFKQLKQDFQYLELCRILNQSEQEAKDNKYLRIFYLSIPPFSYVQTAKSINQYCRPTSGTSSLRVVIEKPFGHDLQSAQELADQIAQYFSDEELYRIDHYIGKSVVQQILPFRATEKVKEVWNRHHISRVDIVMKEVADVKDRIAYYDEYGVINDVIQNHLMELLILVAMEMPGNITDSFSIQHNKLALLEDIHPLHEESSLLGQYEGYLNEVKQHNPNQLPSNTPTFAAVTAFVDNPRWRGVPFVLMSGKKLEERHSYVKIHFRDVDYKFDNFVTAEKRSKEIIFNIGNRYVDSQGIFISKGLAESLLLGKTFSVVHGEEYNVIHPGSTKDAYSTLIHAVFNGLKDQFINTEHLIKSWHIWSPLVTTLKSKKPIIYRGGKNSRLDLDFIIEGRTLRFQNHSHDRLMNSSNSIPESFRGSRLIVLPLNTKTVGMDLLTQLEIDIQNAANIAVREKGVFHVAFSGGSTPLKLFRKLANSVKPFPWQHTHVWVVDERCVAFNHSLSNFKSLWENLLSSVTIPYWNVHPMPVATNSGICPPWEDRVYADQIKHFIPDLRLDFILLGLGMDGHTASIFPGETRRASEPENIVFYSNITSIKRMSMSYELINNSRQVGVLVTGKSKHQILQLIVEDREKRYPISGVEPYSGHLTWYLDIQAWFGY